MSNGNAKLDQWSWIRVRAMTEAPGLILFRRERQFLRKKMETESRNKESEAPRFVEN